MNKRMTQMVTRRKIEIQVERRKRKKMMNQKILNMVQRRKMAEGGKMLDQKILMTCSPSIREESRR